MADTQNPCRKCGMIHTHACLGVRASSPAAVPEGALPPLPKPWLARLPKLGYANYSPMDADDAKDAEIAEWRTFGAAVEADRASETQKWWARACAEREKNVLLKAEMSILEAEIAEWRTFGAAVEADRAQQGEPVSERAAPAVPTERRSDAELLAELIPQGVTILSGSGGKKACVPLDLLHKLASPTTAVEPGGQALRYALSAVDAQLVAILNGAEGSVYNKLKAARNDLVRIWLPLARSAAPVPDTGIPACPCPNLSIEHDNDTGGSFCVGKCPVQTCQSDDKGAA